jgi:hypothetical protein
MCTKCAPNVHRIQKSASFRSLLHGVLHRQSEQVGSVTICCGHHVRVGVKRRADLTMCPNQTTSEAIPEPYESPHSPATFHKPQQHRQEEAPESTNLKAFSFSDKESTPSPRVGDISKRFLFQRNDSPRAPTSLYPRFESEAFKCAPNVHRRSEMCTECAPNQPN